MTDYIAFVPGGNPGPTTHCGSNVFLVGQKDHQERIMVDAGDLPGKNKEFI